ncbi:MAG: HAMP domain-containing sensor histidine kinase [Pseudomonadota bacterium]
MFIRAFQLNDRLMVAAAKGRVANVWWRTMLGVIYALAAACAFQSIWFPLAWFVSLCATAAFDSYLAKRYLAAETDQQREFRGALFVAACAFTQIVFVSLTVGVGLWAGPAGRAVSLMIATSSIMSAVMYMMSARAFMAITLAPSGFWLAAASFIPISSVSAAPIPAALAMFLATAGFFISAGRTVINNGKLMSGLRTARMDSQQRQAAAEAKQAEAEEASRVKSEFLTTMTHELRTPLNAVIGYSEIIGEDMEAEGFNDLAKDASRITSAARHLLGLIDQILQLTQIDAGKTTVESGDVDVRKLIESSVATVSELARANNNRIATRISPDVGVAFTDGEKLNLCISNLLSNAAKFTSNGLVAISAERETADGYDWLRIAVSDTGVGMTEEEIAKAFQPFTQIDGSKTRAQGGMGLGLSITARTAKVLGGEISAVSEPNAGSTFTLRIPLRFEPNTGEEDDVTKRLDEAARLGAAA